MKKTANIDSFFKKKDIPPPIAPVAKPAAVAPAAAAVAPAAAAAAAAAPAPAAAAAAAAAAAVSSPLDAFYATLTPAQRLAHATAKLDLGTSYDPERTRNYQTYLEKK